ncbi:MAG: nitrous oxide reductase accessory protein NosL [Deltaproteobacteria bacterium]|nr:nitrous oxide reductase accessory protein NosL [Deltaproteobacteria bacterium]
MRMLFLFLTFMTPGGIAHADPAHPGPKDHCPVCGMFVAKYDRWLAQVVLPDGRHRFFDGPKDLFRYILEPKKYDHDVDKNQIREVYVTDYYTTQTVPAEKALFVVGSDVMGPMGPELVPVLGQEKAETFRKDHRGKRILSFHEVTLLDLPGMQ